MIILSMGCGTPQEPSVVQTFAAPEPAAEDAALLRLGRSQFTRCRSCHSLKPGTSTLFGPHLAGIVGRRAASVEDFDYSDEVKALDFDWDTERLDAWLAAPDTIAPGMCKTFAGIAKPEKRRALIAYMEAEGRP